MFPSGNNRRRAWKTRSTSSVACTIAEIFAEATSNLVNLALITVIAFSVKYCHGGGRCEMSQAFAFKQALIIRLDLKIGRGKIAVQCAHAAVSAAEDARIRFPRWWRQWMEDGQCKVALKVPDLETMLNLEGIARKNQLPVYLVRDRGLTQVPPDTITCVGIGPAPSDLVDNLTGRLSLL
jgi:peptidyl-tRNA hydrolase, PTH2 family